MTTSRVGLTASQEVLSGQGTDQPSRWTPRLAFAGLALLACGVAAYLGLFQLHVVGHVWEPFFGDGSRQILRQSWVARLLPIPDAMLGAAGYLAEATLALLGGTRRWCRRPWLVLLEASAASAMLLGSILLAAAQPLLFGAGCTLCLVTSACSVALAWLIAGEALAAARYLWRVRHRGASYGQALSGADGS